MTGSESYKNLVQSVEGDKLELYRAGRKDKFLVKPQLMPHHIRILSVRSQRLQDITEEECLAEGIGCDNEKTELKYYLDDGASHTRFHFRSAKEAFVFFFTQTEKRMRNIWEKNPPVYAYTFETID